MRWTFVTEVQMRCPHELTLTLATIPMSMSSRVFVRHATVPAVVRAECYEDVATSVAEEIGKQRSCSVDAVNLSLGQHAHISNVCGTFANVLVFGF